MNEKPWKFLGLSFDHMHQGDLLRLVHEHPRAEIAGIYHRETGPMEETIAKFNIPRERVYTDLEACLRETGANVAMLCPTTGAHAELAEAVAPHGLHLLIEKPFAANLGDADRITAAMKDTGKELLINWPLRWVASHVTAKRLLDEGVIGEPNGLHYYNGNRGPLRHGADKIEKEPGVKADSWWYQKDKAGGSLLDYLGYGTTLGTWYLNGKAPIEVCCMVDEPEGLEVDEHSLTAARYDFGLACFETRWGTFSDPWLHQPQPKTGFVIAGTRGTLASYDYEKTIRLQTEDCPEGREVPVDELPFEESNAIAYYIHCLENGRRPEGPLSPEIARIGQQIVDTAYASAREKRTLPLFT
ncbi:MAG: Gfo/Idh/MocA family oxidoreductase [Verrucomicrobia bacterium]|jgi:glucose-fructose oxidoreductase|nr:Gfo/Idh/MocA family oxidoreductase [Verrucomicrobiota bacterium]